MVTTAGLVDDDQAKKTYAEFIKQQNEAARKVYGSAAPTEADVKEYAGWAEIGDAWGSKVSIPGKALYGKIREGDKLDVGKAGAGVKWLRKQLQ